MYQTIGGILLSDKQEKLERLLAPMKLAEAASDDDGEALNSLAAKTVYHKKLKPGDGDKRICWIHFYHFKLSGEKLVVQHYLHSEPNAHDPNLWTDFMHEVIKKPYPPVNGRSRKPVTEVLKQLLKNARNTGQQYPEPTNEPINRIEFNERSFLAFCFDLEGWEFPTDWLDIGDPPPPELPAVFFTEGGRWTKNHSFFDGRTAHVDINNVTIPIFYMVNHAKRNDHGDDLLTDEKQPIKFNIVVKIPMKGTTEKLTVIFDPGGTNLGPPRQP